MKKQAGWTIQQRSGYVAVWAGKKLIAHCFSRANTCLVVSSPIVLEALVKAERALLKSNRNKDGSQLQNTGTARLLAEVIAPALDAARGKTKGATPKRRPLTSRASLPV